LAPYLGRTSAADQERHLRLALARLARQQQEAEAEAAVQARLWRWLGVCVGGLLVIALA
jgi:Stage III sporulation protein AB (spore_III_AB).